jgi:hypothetical protein
MVKLSEDHGMCGKFTGSGGAIVLMRRDANPKHIFRTSGTGDWFDDLTEQHIREDFKARGFHFERISVSPPV